VEVGLLGGVSRSFRVASFDQRDGGDHVAGGGDHAAESLPVSAGREGDIGLQCIQGDSVPDRLRVW
jgi:hypothetical protein